MTKRRLTYITLALLATIPVAMAQEAGMLRPSLDTNIDGTQTGQPDLAPAPDNTQPAGPAVQRTNAPRLLTAPTNAPRPITLNSTQPQQPAAVPPGSPVQLANTTPPATAAPALTARTPVTGPYDPLGIRSGGLTLFPSVQLTGVYTSNVASDTSGEESDYGLNIAPALRLQSNWLRHSLIVNASASQIFYARNSDFNTTSVASDATLRLDVRRTTNLEFRAGYALTSTPPSNSEVPGNAISQRNDHELSASGALVRRFSRLEATLRAGATWFLFDNVRLSGGGVENNADREYVEPSASIRLGWRNSAALTPYVEVAYTPRIHKQRIDRNGLRRDSDGITVLAGATFNFSPLWAGDAALVYEYRNFDDPSLRSINAVGLNANINWRPDRLTTITFRSTTTLDESATLGISGTRNYGAGIDLTRLLRENLQYRLNLDVSYSDFIGSSADDIYYTARTGLTYSFNRKAQWLIDYQMNLLDSGTPGMNTIEHRISTGFNFRL